MATATTYAITATRAARPELMPGNLRLHRSVGAGGANARAEVVQVQGALNGIPPALGGPETALAPDGVAGSRTVAAIRGFQSGWLDLVDGRLDPGGPTLQCLNAALGVPTARAAGDLPARATGRCALAWAALGGAVVGASGIAAARAVAARGPAPRSDPVILDIIRAMNRLDDLRDNVLFGVEMTVKAGVRMAERAFDYANLLVTPSRGLPGWNSREAPGRLAFLLLAKHFHLSEAEPTAALAAATRVLEVARRIQLRTVSRRGAFGVLFDQSDRYVATFRRMPHTWGAAAYNVVLGAADVPPRPSGQQLPSFLPAARAERTDRIYLTPLWDLGDSIWKQVALIHELAHYVGGVTPGIDDHAYADQAHYPGLPRAVRLRNTDCYALFLAERYHGTVNAARARGIDQTRMGNAPFVAADGEIILAEASGPQDPFAFPCGFPTRR